jgi:hypothetical protein
MRSWGRCALTAVAAVALVLATRSGEPARSATVIPGQAEIGGAYTGCLPDKLAAWQQLSGVDDQKVVSDSADFGTWATLLTTTGERAQCWWDLYRGTHPGSQLLMAMPLLPASDGAGGTPTLAQGAAGLFTHTDATTGATNYWKQIADALINAHGADTMIRLGWEFNGNWYPWSAGADLTSFKAYWKLVVDDMRGEQAAMQLAHPELNQGKHFSFVWNPDSGFNPLADATTAWPGSAYVDMVSIDLYDRDWSAAPGDGNCTNDGQMGYPIPTDATPARVTQIQQWVTQQLIYAHGPTPDQHKWSAEFWREWSVGKGKPFSVSEWGLSVNNAYNVAQPGNAGVAVTDCHGGGDDPYFIRQVLDWSQSVYAGQSISFALYFQTADVHVAAYLTPTATTLSAGGTNYVIAAAPQSYAAMRSGIKPSTAFTKVLGTGVIPVTTTAAAGNTWLVGTYGTSQVRDIYRLVTSGTASGKVEVYIYDGRNPSVQLAHLTTAVTTAAAQGVSWSIADANGDGLADLYAVRTKGTTSGRIEAVALLGDYGTASFTTMSATYVSPWSTLLAAGSKWSVANFGGTGTPGLVRIQTTGTASGDVEVHVRLLDGSGTSDLVSSYPVAAAAGYRFTVSDYDGDTTPDLVKITAAGLGTANVPVTIRRGDFLGTVLTSTTSAVSGATVAYDRLLFADADGDGIPDLFAIQTAGTASGKVEVEALSGAT